MMDLPERLELNYAMKFPVGLARLKRRQYHHHHHHPSPPPPPPPPLSRVTTRLVKCCGKCLQHRIHAFLSEFRYHSFTVFSNWLSHCLLSPCLGWQRSGTLTFKVRTDLYVLKEHSRREMTFGTTTINLACEEKAASTLS